MYATSRPSSVQVRSGPPPCGYLKVPIHVHAQRLQSYHSIQAFNLSMQVHYSHNGNFVQSRQRSTHTCEKNKRPQNERKIHRKCTWSQLRYNGLMLTLHKQLHMSSLKLVEDLSLPITTQFNPRLMLKVWWNKIFNTYKHDNVCFKIPCICQQADLFFILKKIFKKKLKKL